MTRYPSLQLISPISVRSYFFSFRLPCRAPPATLYSVDSSTCSWQGSKFPLVSRSRPAYRWSLSKQFSNLPARVAQSCENFLIHLVHVSTFPTIHHNYTPAGHSLGNSLYEETCFSFNTLSFGWFANLPGTKCLSHPVGWPSAHGGSCRLRGPGMGSNFLSFY